MQNILLYPLRVRQEKKTDICGTKVHAVSEVLKNNCNFLFTCYAQLYMHLYVLHVIYFFFNYFRLVDLMLSTLGT